MRLAQLSFSALQRISPNTAAALAERLFFTPRQARLPAEAVAILEEATPFALTVAGRRLMGWSWGNGPAVYLVHGWGSRGGHLGAFVAPLLAEGFRVVTHDALGQGASDSGLTSMPEFARGLRAVVDAVGPAHGIIAHSMGASATALAMTQGLEVARAVFLAPAANPAAYVTPFATALGLNDDVVRRMKERSERRIALRWDELDVPGMARHFDVPLLVFHDQEDRMVPWSDGAKIAAAWRDSQLVSTNGLGHKGILREPGVVEWAVAHIAQRRALQARNLPGSGAEALERELFVRDERWSAVVVG
jgi:pimeloyl-ACP methyl ester carboxylesterase